MKNASKSAGIKATYAVVAAALLGVLVMPLAAAGAKKGPSKNTAVTAQIKKLSARIAALENRQTPVQATAAPVGPAGGDLRGTYPNPTIGPDTVSGVEVEDGTIGGADVTPDSLGDVDLALDSVGSSELKGVTATVGTGVAVAANNSNVATVTCPAGSMVIAGGHAWLNNQAGTSIIASAPDENQENTTWVVEGRATTANTLFAWANCLAV